MSVLMNICDLLVVAVAFGFFILSATDLALRLVKVAAPTIKAHAEASVTQLKPAASAVTQPKPTAPAVTPKPQPKAPVTQPKPVVKAQPKSTVSDVIRTEAAFRSVGSAAVDYSKMTVRELRALCQADKAKFAGYSPYVKKGQAALVKFMQSR